VSMKPAPEVDKGTILRRTYRPAPYAPGLAR